MVALDKLGRRIHERTKKVTHMDDSWKLKGACWDSDPSVFFPGHGQNAAEAHKICQGCAVQAECLDYALTVNTTHSDAGIWAGTHSGQRHKLRMKRNKRAG